MNIVDQRRTYQLNFLQSKQEIEVGNKDHLPLPIDELVKIDAHSSCVEQVFSAGLTAIVYKIRVGNHCYNLNSSVASTFNFNLYLAVIQYDK